MNDNEYLYSDSEDEQENKEDAGCESLSTVFQYQDEIKKIRILEHFLKFLKIADGLRLCIILCRNRADARDVQLGIARTGYDDCNLHLYDARYHDILARWINRRLMRVIILDLNEVDNYDEILELFAARGDYVIEWCHLDPLRPGTKTSRNAYNILHPFGTFIRFSDQFMTESLCSIYNTIYNRCVIIDNYILTYELYQYLAIYRQPAFGCVLIAQSWVRKYLGWKASLGRDVLKLIVVFRGCHLIFETNDEVKDRLGIAAPYTYGGQYFMDPKNMIAF